MHSGIYGREMIDGMQTKDAKGHPKMLAYLKHYTGYSREQNRMHSEDNKPNLRPLWSGHMRTLQNRTSLRCFGPTRAGVVTVDLSTAPLVANAT